MGTTEEYIKKFEDKLKSNDLALLEKTLNSIIASKNVLPKTDNFKKHHEVLDMLISKYEDRIKSLKEEKQSDSETNTEKEGATEKATESKKIKTKSRSGRPKKRQPDTEKPTKIKKVKEKGKRGRPKKQQTTIEKSDETKKQGRKPIAPNDKITNLAESIGINEKINITKDIVLIKLTETNLALEAFGQLSFEIVKKNDKWFVTCKIEQRQPKEGFNTVGDAVYFIIDNVYFDQLRSIVKQKKEKAQKQKEWRKKHPEGETKPAEDIEKASEKVVEKIEKKAETGKPVEHDLLGAIKKLKADFIEPLQIIIGSPEVAIKDKREAIKEIDRLISELNQLKRTIKRK